MKEDDRYLIEFVQIGGSVKVSAIDPVSLTEASIIGPASATRAELSRAAVQKLKYVLEKQKKN